MLAFLKALVAFLTLVLEHVLNKGRKRADDANTKQHEKAAAYDKLRKALDARASSDRSDADTDLMSDDGYRRD